MSAAEGDAPCAGCGAANVTCFDSDGYCCAGCCESHGATHTIRTTSPGATA